MTSRADRDRARRARTIAEAERVKLAPPPELAARPAPGGASIAGARRRGRDDGLDMLLERRRITPLQAETGRFYGMIWRAAQITGGPIRVLDLACAGGGGKGDGAAIVADDLGWIADCRAQLALAHQALGHHAELIATVDLICGAGMRPREISTEQRETEQIETGLRLALDILRLALRAQIDRTRLARFS